MILFSKRSFISSFENFRTINLDSNRSRPLRNTSERSLIQTDEGNQNIFSSYSMKNGKRRHTTQVHDGTRIQELNVPTILPVLYRNISN